MQGFAENLQQKSEKDLFLKLKITCTHLPFPLWNVQGHLSMTTPVLDNNTLVLSPHIEQFQSSYVSQKATLIFMCTMCCMVDNKNSSNQCSSSISFLAWMSEHVFKFSAWLSYCFLKMLLMFWWHCTPESDVRSCLLQLRGIPAYFIIYLPLYSTIMDSTKKESGVLSTAKKVEVLKKLDSSVCIWIISETQHRLLLI